MKLIEHDYDKYTGLWVQTIEILKGKKRSALYGSVAMDDSRTRYAIAFDASFYGIDLLLSASFYGIDLLLSVGCYSIMIGLGLKWTHE